jgi:hypothetical protein
MQLIGINGFKRSGKGTVADIISDHLEDEVVYQIGFADKLKMLAAQSLGFDRAPRDLIALMDEAKESWRLAVFREAGGNPWHDLTGRELLQNLGNNARNLFGDSFWVDQVLPLGSAHPVRDVREIENKLYLEHRYPGIDRVLITDLRYQNEAERVKSLGGTIIEVTRPGVESDGHASEQPLPRHLVDVTFVNDGTVDELRDKVIKHL